MRHRVRIITIIIIHSKSIISHIIIIINCMMFADEDSLSDSSSSSDGSDGSPNQANDIRQISREQLTAALMQAGAASRNSLSNISQRNNQAAVAAAAATTDDAGPSTSQSMHTTPSTSASTSSATAVASGSSGGITSSLLGDALSHALGQVMPSMGGVGQSAPPPAAADVSMASETSESGQSGQSSSLHERYASELVVMQEMGLNDQQMNLQALEVTNGDVEAAINLVFSAFSST